MNIVAYNREAWNHESRNNGTWSIPVDTQTIKNAQNGDWNVILTPNKAVPSKWFGDVVGKKILGLASGGGQQVPVLAAAGGMVTSFDNSDVQLEKDLEVANREGLKIETIRGDMCDLSVFDDESFDLIFHPVSNCFIQDVNPVWRESFRVLKKGGRLLTGFMKPSFFMFNHEEAEKTGHLEVKYSIPYSDLTSISEKERNKLIEENEQLSFGHSLDDQIGGQIAAGFHIIGLYEDDWNDEATPLNKYTKIAIATLAKKPIEN